MSFYYPPWENALEPNQGLYKLSFAAPARAIASVWHRCGDCLFASNALLFVSRSRTENGLFGSPPSALVPARIATELRPLKERSELFSAIFTPSRNLGSFFPRLFGQLALGFLPLWGFEPLSCLCELDSSFVKVKASGRPMPLKMVRSAQHLKVSNIVVILIAVLVMNVHSFWNGPVMIYPNPPLGVNRHVIVPIAVRSFPKGLSKIFSFFDFSHRSTNVSQSLVSLSKVIEFNNGKLR